MRDPSTGQLEYNFPEHKRRPMRRRSLVTSAGMFLLLLGTVVSIFVYKAILYRTGAKGFFVVLPSLLNSVQITVFTVIYKVEA